MTEVVYEENEKVIARDSAGNNYESKVLQVRKGKYFVHYDGWNSRWDEWITPDRMMKLTEENKAIAKLKTKKPSGKKPKTEQDVAVDDGEPSPQEGRERDEREVSASRAALGGDAAVFCLMFVGGAVSAASGDPFMSARSNVLLLTMLNLRVSPAQEPPKRKRKPNKSATGLPTIGAGLRVV